jgi:hypothetical protein
MAMKKKTTKKVPRVAEGAFLRGTLHASRIKGAQRVQGVATVVMAPDGLFYVNGVPETELVNKHPKVKADTTPILHTKLPKAELSKLVAAMKVV